MTEPLTPEEIAWVRGSSYGNFPVARWIATLDAKDEEIADLKDYRDYLSSKVSQLEDWLAEKTAEIRALEDEIAARRG